MWPTFRANSNIMNSQSEERETQKSFCSVNDEYYSALRTRSCAEFFKKAQAFVKGPPSKSSAGAGATLLEPGQEAVSSVLQSPVLMNSPELKGLLINYFDISAAASRLCMKILENTRETQSNSRFIQHSLDSIENSSPERVDLAVSELVSFLAPMSPFSYPEKDDFKVIHDDYKSVSRRLNRMRMTVAGKIRRIRILKSFSAAVVSAAQALTVLVSWLFFRPSETRRRGLKSGVLSKVGEQLDVAAKGTYILNRDFDTTSRLVARMDDSVEHNRAIILQFLERKEEKFAVAVMEELKKSNRGLGKQVEELEEHLYLCLVTINRARALVIDQVASKN